MTDCSGAGARGGAALRAGEGQALKLLLGVHFAKLVCSTPPPRMALKSLRLLSLVAMLPRHLEMCTIWQSPLNVLRGKVNFFEKFACLPKFTLNCSF